MSGSVRRVLVEISVGELVDKLSILKIKLERLTDPDKLRNVHREYNSLLDVSSKLAAELSESERTALDYLKDQLLSVNKDLWYVEDELRLCTDDTKFIKLAKLVPELNGIRSDLKRQINILVRSDLVEEKSYAEKAASPEEKKQAARSSRDSCG